MYFSTVTSQVISSWWEILDWYPDYYTY